MTYLERLAQRRAPQSAPVPGSEQVRTSEDGFARAIAAWTRLRRFLNLGSEGGTFCTGERNLAREKEQALELCLVENVQADGALANGFTIADPNDPGMLDVVRFDTAAPQLISDFARGAL